MVKPYSLQLIVVHYRVTVKPPNKGHIGDGPVVLVEKLSSSRRFSFKPIGNFKITLKCIIMIYSASF